MYKEKKEKAEYIFRQYQLLPQQHLNDEVIIDIFAPLSNSIRKRLFVNDTLRNIKICARSITASIQLQFAGEQEQAVFAAALAVENAAELASRHIKDKMYEEICIPLLGEAVTTLMKVVEK